MTFTESLRHLKRLRDWLCLIDILIVVILVYLHEYSGKSKKSYTVRNAPEA